MPKPAKPNTTFWTEKRLRELGKLFHKLTIKELEKHFGKKGEELHQAYEFWLQHKRLKISVKTVKRVRITTYAAGYAEGSEDTHVFHNEVYVV